MRYCTSLLVSFISNNNAHCQRSYRPKLQHNRTYRWNWKHRAPWIELAAHFAGRAGKRQLAEIERLLRTKDAKGAINQWNDKWTV